MFEFVENKISSIFEFERSKMLHIYESLMLQTSL